MTYSSGGLVQATDYNSLANNGTNIANHWGVGTGAAGLGQSTSAITALSAGATVTAAQWTGLLQTVNSCLAHEGQTAITPASVTAGNIITAYASIATGSSSAYTNRGTTGVALSASGVSTASTSTAWGSASPYTLVTTHTVTFASGDAARYFFNAGGNLAMTVARSGGSATTINTNWTNLCNAVGTIKIEYKNTTKTGGSGTPTTLRNANNGGYWNLTGSDITHFQQFDTAATYTSDYIAINARWSGTAQNGGSPVLTITTSFYNGAGTTAGDTVDGTTSSSLVVNSPSTTYLTNTWGSPTVGAVVSAQSGTTAAANTFGFYQTIAANTQNYNLKASAVAAGWNQVQPLVAQVTINPGVYVGASSTGVYAFDTGVTFPVGSTLRINNNGYILGAGGAGANGAYEYWDAFVATHNPYYLGQGVAGAAGGHALRAQNAVTVYNYGCVAGGGGGGGGSGGGLYAGPGGTFALSGSGGGGGAGWNAGAGGTQGPNDTYSLGKAYGPAGAAGNTVAGGAGGVYNDPSYGAYVSAGNGGSIGVAGFAGQAGSQGAGAGGGAAGAYVVGGGNVSWPVTGLRYGAAA